MDNYIKHIQHSNIYENEELKKTLIKLENKYNITNEISLFQNLVNFSNNSSIPFHGWFKYREGYAHSLVKEILDREELHENEVVIDPFCGSGTTLIQAMLEHRPSFGLDVNPISALITNTKTSHYSKGELKTIRHHIDKLYHYDLTVDYFNNSQNEDMKKYFNKVNFNDLMNIKNYINQLDDEKLKNIFLLCYISIIEDCSDRKRDGNGLKTSLSKVTNVKYHYLSKLEIIYTDLCNSVISTETKSHAKVGSALNLKAEFNNEFSKYKNYTPGCIIFSPPYANSFDYFESYKMELVMGGFVEKIKDIKSLRQNAIRSFVNSSENTISTEKVIDLLAMEIEKAIPLKEKITGKRDARTRKVPNMIRAYFSDMSRVLEQCSDLLPKGKKVYIVVDQSAYLGKIIPTDLLLAFIAEQFKLVTNEIIICRKAKTSSQQLQKFPYLKETLRESIIVLEKN